ncbi:MAG: UDP-GlcNAc:undecaprenyl-phosphate GlcNAc-1-phosphate transferase [Desulforhopalus sp.]|jgi:UDP-GlcNAc:undecaprenyl-phosphate GlcNAc-1-phosphate transferase
MLTFEMRIILVFLVSFFSVVVVLPKISSIAQRIGLLDQPNGRKVHTMPRPLVGGIGMVMAVTFTSLALIPIVGLRGYFLGLTILLLVGFFDDFREMGHQQKFMAQIIATGAMIYFSKVALVTFGDLLGIGSINIPGGNAVIWIVTIFCVVGVTNAVNLIDGLDGLAGGLSFIAFMFFAAHASFADNHTLMLLNLALAGAVLGFLKFNWYPSVLFMGDAGSLCLGFSLAFTALALTQGPNSATSPVIALLILAVPITDTIIVMTKRIMQGKSPFKPDKSHLHHIFLRYGMNRTRAVQTILTISVFIGGLSLLGPIYGVRESWLFLLYGIYFITYLAASFYIVGVFRYTVRRRKKRQHLARSDMFSRLLYGSFDHFKMFRKAKRYNVNLPMHCTIHDDEPAVRGQILNISRTGCMIKMPAFDAETVSVKLACSFPIGEELMSCTLDSEHLWAADQDGFCYHGLRFADLSAETKKTLILYLNSIPAHHHHEGSPKHATV